MATLRHIQLSSLSPLAQASLPRYGFAARLQGTLQRELLTWKARPSHRRGPPPPPSLLSFTPAPTYTLGRRQTEPLSDVELAGLHAPLHHGGSFQPTVVHAPRGGLATYHGPGQLVLWPVIDLHSPLYPHLSVRNYACLLEKTTIATLARLWGIAGFTTENPGVWVRSIDNATSVTGPAEDRERKIAALGVHLRRHVTGLGVAINYNTPVTGPAETNPWARIVPCGLGGHGVTSVCAELGHDGISTTLALDELSRAWASEFESRLQIHVDAATMTQGYDVSNWRNGLASSDDDFVETQAS
ncbi:hypothetical protein F5Y16DRAFT_302846 [Xylariaceae sp. FL0255]|nr:hypothetical protein F5Y16DRAFT_302846 [Xylariaceae sp. FL0255]